MKKVLITGGSGKLGKEVVKVFSQDKNYIIYSPSHTEMDITDGNVTAEKIKLFQPDILIHLAALTSPPRCEANKQLAWKVNVVGTENIVDALEKFCSNCYLVYMSTPCVFSGEDETPKDEDYLIYPDNFYGLTKAIGEIVVKRSKLKWLIIRGNFVPYEKWPYEKAFIDRKSNYLFAHQLAKGMKEVIEAGLRGIVHILGDKVLSMYELARLCPNSENVGKLTLEEYYKENPNSCKLTKNMVMESKRWKKYKIEEI